MVRPEIAKALGVPVATLCKSVRRLGVQPIHYSFDHRLEPERLYESGLSRQQVAKNMGLNIKTVSPWLKPRDYRRFYALELIRKTRLLAKNRIPKREISLRLNVR